MKRFATALVIILVLVCGIGGYVYRQFSAAKEAMEASKKATAKVERGDLVVQVVDTGAIDAVKVVELKSRASGRLSKLYVDEGDIVKTGQLIAVIDPKETQLRVDQDRAQVRGAKSNVARQDIEISQRRITSAAAYRQARTRIAQLEKELRIQPTLTSTAIASAEATLSVAKEEKNRLVTSVHPNQKTSAESAVTEARANYEQADREYNRQQELLKQGYVALKSLESARVNLDVTRTRLDDLSQTLSRLESQQKIELLKADQDIRRAESDVIRAKANAIQDDLKKKEYESAIEELKKAESGLRDADAMQQSREQSMASIEQLESVLSDSERQLGETEIRSPIDGVVTKKLVQEGELVASLSSFSSGSPIVRIEDRRTLMVKLNVNEIDTARIAKGMAANIEVDAIPGKVFKGAVRKISPASNAVAGSETVVKYAVEIWITGTDERLRSGMSAKCTLEVQRRNNVLNLPLEYVAKDEKGESYVELPAKSARPDAKPTRQAVKTGFSTGSKIEILSGANEGLVVQKPTFSGPERKGFMQTGPDDGG